MVLYWVSGPIFHEFVRMGGPNCALTNCTARSDYNRGLSFHKIPKKGLCPEKDSWRDRLLQSIDRQDKRFLEERKKVNARIYICSRHFKPECFSFGLGAYHRLIPGSLPTEFMPQRSVATPKPEPRKPLGTGNHASSIFAAPRQDEEVPESSAGPDVQQRATDHLTQMAAGDVKMEPGEPNTVSEVKLEIDIAQEPSEFWMTEKIENEGKKPRHKMSVKPRQKMSVKQRQKISVEELRRSTLAECRTMPSQDLVSKLTLFRDVIQDHCSQLTQQLDQLSTMHKQVLARWETAESLLTRRCESVKEKLCATLDARHQELVLQVNTMHCKALKPLADHRCRIKQQIDGLTTMKKDLQETLSSEIEANRERVFWFLSSPHLKVFERNPLEEVPTLKGLRNISLESVCGLEEKMKELLEDQLNIAEQPSLHIVAVNPTPAGLTVAWEQDDSNYSQFHLQRASGDLTRDNSDTNFRTVYEGPATSVTLLTNPGSCVTFRVCGRNDQMSMWSPWSYHHHESVEDHHGTTSAEKPSSIPRQTTGNFSSDPQSAHAIDPNTATDTSTDQNTANFQSDQTDSTEQIAEQLSNDVYLCDHSYTCNQMQSQSNPDDKPVKCVLTASLKAHKEKHDSQQASTCGQPQSSVDCIQPKKKFKSKQSYSCDECDVTFKLKSSLKTHKKKHKSQQVSACSQPLFSNDLGECLKPKENSKSKQSSSCLPQNRLQCTECPALLLKASMNRHMLIHSGKKVQCSECSAVLAKGSLHGHMQIHSGKKFQCSECPRLLSYKSTLAIHMRMHTGAKPFKCKFCGMGFRQRSPRARHVLIHTGEKPHLCDVCGYKTRYLESLKTHSRKHTKEKPFECSLCDAKFSSSTGLRHHRFKHSGERLFVCDQCGKRLMSATCLKNHKLIHAEKAFSCDECGAKFATPALVRYHKRKHSDYRPFKCNYCDKSFKGRQTLTIHIRQHTGEKPFVCSVCNASFRQQGQLNRHSRTHTGERPYVCKDCGANYAHKELLDEHVRKHTGERPYACDKCSATFAGYHSLKTHKRRHIKKNDHLV